MKRADASGAAARDRRIAAIVSRERSRIFTVLSERLDHPTFHELYTDVKASGLRCARSTLVAALRDFIAKGLVARHVFKDGRTRFEAIDRRPHAHLVNIDSGEVVEFGIDELLPALNRRAANLGYELRSFRFEL